VLFAAVSAYYYLRVVMVMYMRDPESVEGPMPRLVTSPAMTIVLASTVAGVILLGLYPNPLVAVVTHAVLSLK
jgi:NADH-quinone oxidoreductase subunit N